MSRSQQEYNHGIIVILSIIGKDQGRFGINKQ